VLIAEDTRSRPAPPVPAGGAHVSPYPGLRPFGERDSRLFFGREGEVAALLELLEAQQLVVVHGASGCGKSSVVRAGLLPLFRTDALANNKIPAVSIVRPADEGGPLHSLAHRLSLELGPPGVADTEEDAATSWANLLTTSHNWVTDIADKAAAVGKVLCIVFDQFEEAFSAERAGHGPQVRRIIEFLNGLGEAAPAGTALGGRDLTVIVTMRSDYLGHCAIWDHFAETVNRCQYLLPRITNFGLLRSIYEPARLHGGSVDENVADNLLSVVKSELDGLPIVQHALMRAWHIASESSPDRTVRLDDQALAAVGGPGRALSVHADEVLEEAIAGYPARQECAEWLLRALCDLDSDGRIIRRSASFRDLYEEVGAPPELVAAILEPFRRADNSLIMPASEEKLHDETIVTVSHEALLRRWERISDLSINDRGQVKGYAYRELQDGLVWRALSVQAQQFARDGNSILGPASTEQRLPWFRTIQRRPGWIKRHQVDTLAGVPDFKQQWQQVSDLMVASEQNLLEERTKLEREKKLVATLRESRKKAWLFQMVSVALLVLLFVLATYIYIERIRGVEKERDRAVRERQIFLDNMNANLSAQKYCVSKFGTPQYQNCIIQKAGEFSRFLQSQPTTPELPLPQSPYAGGGFVKPKR